uniref:C3H1-type domain-containing protein n=1 Tax=Chlamydomonas euryale TaxID=1486919 RepID=A0A7R9V8C1_9CHLO|mmetsp:Transcript_25623/g.75772  ORF Transcript_25623/g.75772 Transcript_25623/m.75772 type:complete len:218 (+) Transcript_25623:285-938(+)
MQADGPGTSECLPMQVCTHFLRGTCRFGTQCRFQHVAASSTTAGSAAAAAAAVVHTTMQQRTSQNQLGQQQQPPQQQQYSQRRQPHGGPPHGRYGGHSQHSAVWGQAGGGGGQGARTPDGRGAGGGRRSADEAALTDRVIVDAPAEQLPGSCGEAAVPFGPRFRMMSYNILADEYATQYAHDLYRGTPHFCLEWRYRLPRLVQEVATWRPSVVCFQV